MILDNSVREQRQIKNYPGIISNKMLIGRTLHDMSVCTHRVDNMAGGSAGMLSLIHILTLPTILLV